MGKYLVKLARRAIRYYLTYGTLLSINPTQVPKEYRKAGAVFVTLTYQDGRLRGCIGDIISTEPIYLNVIKNAVNAAVNDPRFPPLTEPELNEVVISISLISPPKQYFYHTPDELLTYLQKHKPGVIIRQGGYKAVFLPEVWEDLPEADRFLSALCRKAGLASDCWQEPDVEVFTFQTKTIKEA